MSKEVIVEEVNTEDQAIELMKEANKLVGAKDKEIAELKLKLAKSELYRTVDDDDVKIVEFDINKKFDPKGKSNYEICEYAAQVHDHYVSIGQEDLSPLNADGEGSGTAVAEFFKACIAEANEQDNPHEAFLSIYQTKIGADTAKAKNSYNKYK